MSRRDITEIKVDRDKLLDLVHYICHRAPNPRQLGATKLNKILLFSDREAFLKLGSPVTGEVYRKKQFGPVSDSLESVLQELQASARIVMTEVTGSYAPSGEPYQHRLFYSLRQPSLTRFSADEISIVDSVLELICRRHSARSISDLSHDVVWRAAAIGEELPYYTSFTRFLGQVGVDEMEWAVESLDKR
jgi:hypothetical protein